MYLLSDIIFSIKSETISSETSEPELITEEILLPIEVFFNVSFLKNSPVDNCYKLNFFSINFDWVPLPAPGGPKITIFIQLFPEFSFFN